MSESHDGRYYAFNRFWNVGHDYIVTGKKYKMTEKVMSVVHQTATSSCYVEYDDSYDSQKSILLSDTGEKMEIITPFGFSERGSYAHDPDCKICKKGDGYIWNTPEFWSTDIWYIIVTRNEFRYILRPKLVKKGEQYVCEDNLFPFSLPLNKEWIVFPL